MKIRKILLDKLIEDNFGSGFKEVGQVILEINNKKIDCTPYIYEEEERLQNTKQPITSKNFVLFNLLHIQDIISKSQNEKDKRLIHFLITMVEYLEMTSNFLHDKTNNKRFNSSSLSKAVNVSRPTLDAFFKRCAKHLKEVQIKFPRKQLNNN